MKLGNLAATLLALMPLTGSASEAATPIYVQTVQIINHLSGKALDEDVNIEGKVQIWRNYHSANQTWRLNHLADGTTEIVNVATGRCLDIQAANIVDPTANGHHAQTWTCTGSPNQRFQLETIYLYNPGGVSGTDGVRIRPAHSNKCLDVVDYSKRNGAGLQQWDCHNGLNQRWDPQP